MENTAINNEQVAHLDQINANQPYVFQTHNVSDKPAFVPKPYIRRAVTKQS